MEANGSRLFAPSTSLFSSLLFSSRHTQPHIASVASSWRSIFARQARVSMMRRWALRSPNERALIAAAAATTAADAGLATAPRAMPARACFASRRCCVCASCGCLAWRSAVGCSRSRTGSWMMSRHRQLPCLPARRVPCSERRRVSSSNNNNTSSSSSTWRCSTSERIACAILRSNTSHTRRPRPRPKPKLWRPGFACRSRTASLAEVRHTRPARSRLAQRLTRESMSRHSAAARYRWLVRVRWREASSHSPER